MIPIKPQPFKDEILSSWLIRAAIANGSDPKSFGGAIWQDYRIWTRDIDRCLPKERAVPLCRAADLTYDQVTNMTLEPVIQRIMKQEHLVANAAWPWVIPTGTRNRSRVNGLHFCPKCLAEAPVYLKKQWRLAWNVACPAHKVMLQLHCPHCHTAFSPHLVDYCRTDIALCQKCGFDLRASSCKPADAEAIALQEHLNSTVETGSVSNSIFPLLDMTESELFTTVGTLLHCFRNVDRCKSIELLSENMSIPLEVSMEHDGHALEAASIRARHSLMVLTAKVLQQTPDRMATIFIDAGITRQMLCGSGSERSPTIEKLYQILPDNHRERISNEHGNKCIEPRDKIGVEELMDEIRKYL